jgi:hypothetical protein
LKLDSALLRDRGLLNSYHLPLHLGQLRRRLLVSADEESRCQKITIAAAVATPSFVRWLSWAPDKVAALVEIACASRASCWHVYDWYTTGETYAGAISAEEEAQPASAAPSTTIPKFRIF